MRIIIAGAGAVGRHLAKLLSREDMDISFKGKIFTVVVAAVEHAEKTEFSVDSDGDFSLCDRINC